ncbi:myelin-associated glycoprotein-like [Callorhinchus milii]|uniref:myelin-associated glycoprotein-like n=1 Tax=Callorhinchus milii TaxID=7868 RepID=UPI0004574AED|nr:myelin-associated glycoprotein-like [Callorhinchus milii]|eukprot:gi/632948468/ref/XP_007889614.1/ PREDICTED: myelin-associated glycoprotein-like [Callorhinchus milii]
MSASHCMLALLLACLIQGLVCQWSVWVDTSASAWEGETVLLNCSFEYPETVRDTQAITARWLKNSPFPNNNQAAEIYNSRNTRRLSPDITLVGDLSEKNCSLQITNINKVDSGIYYFRFEMGQGNNWSGDHGVRVSVYGQPTKPEISIPMELLESDEMSTITCSTSNVDQRGRARLSWEGISELTEDLPVIEEQLSGSTWTVISKVMFIPSYQHHQKLIRCAVDYIPFPYSEDTNVTLQVKYAPKNTMVLVNGTQEEIKEGNCVTLACASNSHPESNYTWYKKDRITENTEILDTTSNVMLFHKISRLDSGFYSCLAANYLGSNIATEVEVDVQYKPDKVTITQDLMYTCVAEASPPAKITWKISDPSINLTNPAVSIMQDVNGTHSSSTLNLDTTANFCVSCLAQNKHGVTVSEKCPPGSYTRMLLLIVGLIAGTTVAIIIFVIVSWKRKKQVIEGRELENEAQPVMYTEVQTAKKGAQGAPAEAHGRRDKEFAYANLQHEPNGKQQVKGQSELVEFVGTV